MNRLIIFICALALAFSGQAYAGKGTRNAAIIGLVGIGAYQLGKHNERNKHRAPRYSRAYARSPMEQAFRSQSRFIRRQLQTQLQEKGYYRSYIDGAWGRGTSGAFEGYAADTGNTHLLTTASGAGEIMKMLLSPEQGQGVVETEVGTATVPGRSVESEELDDLADAVVEKTANPEELKDLQQKMGIADQQITLLNAVLRVQMKAGQQDQFAMAKTQVLKSRIAAIENFRSQVAAAIRERHGNTSTLAGPNMGMSSSKVSGIYPKIPYYLPGTSELGEMRVAPRVTDKGFLIYDLNFMEINEGYERVGETISMPGFDMADMMFGLKKTHEWSAIAQEKGVRQKHEKVAICFPESMCADERAGNSTTEVIFMLSQDGSTGAKIQRNNGSSATGYEFSMESALLLASYLDYMKKEGEADYTSGTVSKSDLDTMFK